MLNEKTDTENGERNKALSIVAAWADVYCGAVREYHDCRLFYPTNKDRISAAKVIMEVAKAQFEEHMKQYCFMEEVIT